MPSIGIFQPSGAFVTNNLVGNTTQATGILTSPTIASCYSGLHTNLFSNNVADDSSAIGVSGFKNISVDSLLKNTTKDSFDSHLLTTADIKSSGQSLASFSWDMEGQPRIGSWSIGADQIGSGYDSNFVTDVTFYISGEGASGFLNLYTLGHIGISSGLPLMIKYCEPRVNYGNIIIDRIGADACADFPNLALWWAARKGNAAASGTIFIAELQDEVFDADTSPNLHMSYTEAQTTADYYYWIRTVEGNEFDGNVTSCTENPTVTETSIYPKLTTNAKYSIYCDVPYTKFTNFAIENVGPYDDSSISTEPVEIYGMKITSGLVDSVLINGVRIHLSGAIDDPVGKTYGIIACSDTDIQNCVINDIRTIIQEVPKIPSIYAYGIYSSGNNNNCYNNLIGHIRSAVSGSIDGTEVDNVAAYGIYTNKTNAASGIFNNIIHNVSYDDKGYAHIGVLDVIESKCYGHNRNVWSYDYRYNASSDRTASGVGSISGINISSELQNYTSGPHFFLAQSFGTQLKSSSQFRNTAKVLNSIFTNDLQGQARGDLWDFGPDEYGSGTTDYLELFTQGYSSGFLSSDLFIKSWSGYGPTGIDLSIPNVHVAISSGIPLVIEAGNTTTGSIPLFLDAGTKTGTFTLFLQERPVNSLSGNMPLFAPGISGNWSDAALTLAISGSRIPSSSAFNLFLYSNDGRVITSNISLFTFTPGASLSSSQDLFIDGRYGQEFNTINFYTQSYSNVSNTAYLYMLGDPIATVTATMPLYTLSNINGSVPLYVSGVNPSVGNINLFLHAGGYFSGINSPLSLMTWATFDVLGIHGSGYYKHLDMFISGGNKFTTSSLTLTIPVQSTGLINNSALLFLQNDYPNIVSTLPLYLSNTVTTSGIPLYVPGGPFDGGEITALNDGWFIGYNNFPLFIQRPNEIASTTMFIEGQGLTDASGNINLALYGVTGVLTSGIQLYIKSSLTSGLNLYTHGY